MRISFTISIVLTLISQYSWAGPTYIQEVTNVKPICLKAVTLSAGVTTFSVTSSSGIVPDPVMRLWDPATNQEKAWNDDSNGTLNPQFTFTVTQPGTYWLIVHAWRQIHYGTANITVSGATNLTFTNVEFGGAVVTVNDETIPGIYEYQTVFVPGPNSMRDSFMWGLTCADDGNQFSDDEGVGLASKIASSGNICRILVSPYIHPWSGSNGGPGDIRIIVNDWQISDWDNDGLGTKLEEALKTCDHSNQDYQYPATSFQPAFTFQCALVFSRGDSDRDGVNDYAETFGVDNGSVPQYLPKWGANPANKDVFIEVDYRKNQNNTMNSNFITVATLRKIQEFFNDGSASDLQNPNNAIGIKIHFDIGRNPKYNDPNTLNSDYTLYGDWGGSQVHDWSTLPTTLGIPSADQENFDWNTISNFEYTFSWVRRHLFRYMTRQEFGSECAGIASSDRLNVYSSSSNQCPRTTAHEIGHALGLQHWGKDEWGEVNCKPNYVSLMSYLHVYKNQFTIDNSNPGFSKTNMSDSIPLNPSSLTEGDGLGAYYNNLNWPAFLSIAPLADLLFDTQVQCSSSSCKVDWNWDGNKISSSIRADIVSNSTCAESSVYNAQELQSINSKTQPNTFKGTPKLIKNGNFLYIFYVDSNGSINYKFAQVRLDGLSGSCNNNMDILKKSPFSLNQPNINCLDWVDGSAFENNVHTVSAISFNSKILLVFTKVASGIITIYSQISTPNNLGIITGWTQQTTRGGGQGSSAIYTPNLSWMRVNPSIYGTDLLIGMFFVDSPNNGVHQWYAFNTSNESWNNTPSDIIDTSNNTIQGPFPAAVTLWPEVSNPESKVCGVIPVNNDNEVELRFYCYKVVDNKWINLSSEAFANGPPTTTSQPDFAYNKLRTSNGGFVKDSQNNNLGQFWLSYKKDIDFGQGKLYYSRAINLNNAPETFTGTKKLFPPSRAYFSGTERFLPGSVMSLLADDQITGLKGAVFRKFGDFHKLGFLPFVDNTFRTTGNHLRGGNDFRGMERTTCLFLHSIDYIQSHNSVITEFIWDHAADKCGSKSATDSIWGY